MSLEQILAGRFLFQEAENMEGRSEKKLRPVVRISMIGIGLGVMMILLSLFIIQGFKQDIQKKINGFSGTIRISNPDNVYGQYTLPLPFSEELAREIDIASKRIDTKALVNSFIDAMSVIKVDSAFSSVLVHGLDSDYDTLFYQEYLKAGRLPDFSKEDSNEVLISQPLAKRLALESGDTFMSYFSTREAVKVRKFVISGLFETGFEDYDQHLMIADQRVLRNVKEWGEGEVSGITITLQNYADSKRVFDELYPVLANRNAKYGERFTMYTVEELNYNIFGWLGLLDANVMLILGLMIAVAGMTIITGIVVLILEKVKAIATLKALGQRDRSLRKVFLLMAMNILLRGILFGNIAALLLAMIQKIWKPISLDPTQYYMTHVPIVIDIKLLLLINLLVFLLVLLFILIPTAIISNIKPSKSLRFE